MQRAETISHEGVVTRASGDGTAEVEIITGSACSGCHAKSVCSAGESDARIITVKSEAPLSTGDRVTVVMELSQGFRALTIGYMIPLILLIVTFMILTIAGAGELTSAMLSFLVVALYYLAVWLLRSRIDKKFEFKIKV